MGETVDRFRVILFGGPRLEDSEGLPAGDGFATRKCVAVLALLAATSERFVSREWLAETLWPDEDPEWQRRRLRNELALLTRVLGADALIRQGRSAVGLAPFISVDVREFQEALASAEKAKPNEAVACFTTALRLGNEDLIPGQYDDPIVELRESLREQWWEALARYLRVAGRTCDFSEVAQWRQVAARRDADRARELPGDTTTDIVSRVELWTAVPRYNASFVGRAEEREFLRQWLATPERRLLTITGPGGVGKTRLIAEAFSEAHFLSLAGIREEGLVIRAIEAALSGLIVKAEGNKQNDTSELLILDNAEHVVGTVAEHIGDFLFRFPQFRLLITSRARLEVESEEELPVAPLPPSESRKLFLDRARTTRASFPDSQEVHAICGLLDGVPLALELAAARALTLQPAQILDQLTDRLNFLIGRRRDVPGRHQSVRATLEWSADLLPAELRRFFERLSVFAGPFSLEAAEAVCGGKLPALNALEALRCHSLLTVESGRDGEFTELRFRLLGILRDFGQEGLTPAERDSASEQMARWYGARVRQAADALHQRDVRPALDTIRGETENLCAALRWLTWKRRWEDLERFAGDVERLVFSLPGFGPIWAVLQEAVAAADEDAPPWLLCHAGGIALHYGAYAEAERLLIRAEVRCRERGERSCIQRVRDLRAYTALRIFDFPRATELLDEAEAEYEAEGNGARLAHVRNLQALVAAAQDQLNQAVELHRHSHRLYIEAGKRGAAAYVDHDLSIALIRLGDAEAARTHLRRALETFLEREEREGVAFCLEAGAELATTLGEPLLGARFLGTADRIREDAHLPLPPYDVRLQEPMRRTLQAALTAETYEMAFTEGKALEFAQGAQSLNEFLGAVGARPL